MLSNGYFWVEGIKDPIAQQRNIGIMRLGNWNLTDICSRMKWRDSGEIFILVNLHMPSGDRTYE